MNVTHTLVNKLTSSLLFKSVQFSFVVFLGALSIEDEKFRELFNLLKPKVTNLSFFNVE